MIIMPTQPPPPPPPTSHSPPDCTVVGIGNGWSLPSSQYWVPGPEPLLPSLGEVRKS